MIAGIAVAGLIIPESMGIAGMAGVEQATFNEAHNFCDASSIGGISKTSPLRNKKIKGFECPGAKTL